MRDRGRGLRGPDRGARPRRRRTLRRRARGARPRRRSRAQRPHRRRHAPRGGRPVGRAHPGPAGEAGGGHGRRHVPDLRRGREPALRQGPHHALHGHDPQARRLRCWPTWVRPSAASTAWRRRCRSTRRGARAKAEQWDGQTFETWIRRNVVTGTGRAMVRLMVTSVFGAEPCDLSLLYLLAYLHSAGLQDRALGVAGGAQERRFVGGSQEVAIRLAAHLGDVVRLDNPVRVIVHGPDGVIVEADQDTARARRVVIAVPPTLAGRIVYDPPMPAAARPAHAEDADGLGDQVHGRVRRALLARRRAERPGRERHRPRAHHVRQHAEHGHAGGAARLLRGARRPRVERARRATSAGAPSSTVSPATSGPAPRTRSSTSSATGAQRSGPAAATARIWRPACSPSSGPRSTEPVGTVHWAGTETAAVWAGYIDGAVRSGERVAREVLAALDGR